MNLDITAQSILAMGLVVKSLLVHDLPGAVVLGDAIFGWEVV